MIQITDPQYYYDLCRTYEDQLILNGKQVVSIDYFYEGFRRWIKNEFNIDNNGTVVLTFEDDRDYTIFMLRWNNDQT